MKGFQQKKGVDFNEIFALVVNMTSIRMVLSIAASMNLEIEQLDIKMTFMYGDLKDKIYMQQPEEFVKKGKKNLVCPLKRSLYELKHASRKWYRKFESFRIPQNASRLLRVHGEVRWWRLPNPPAICRRHVDCRTGLYLS